MANDFKYTVESNSVWNRMAHTVEVYFSLPDDEILEKKKKVGIFTWDLSFIHYEQTISKSLFCNY